MVIKVPSKFNPLNHPDITIEWDQGLFKVVFEAMACHCYLLIELEEKEHIKAHNMALLAAIECWRIEYKYSRYQKNNYLDSLHQAKGSWFTLDDESYRLFCFADQAWQLSNGLFDITSGILGKAWRFNKKANIPEQDYILKLLGNIGWNKVQLDPQMGIKLPPNMSLDLGGLGKEYAVDRVLQLLNHHNKDIGFLVNFGGDIACNKSKAKNQPWLVGIDSPYAKHSHATLSLSFGALATSGDSERFIMHKGKRYSHVLNPLTGWPVENAPRSVTIAAPTCIQAGLIATLTLLQGKNASEFVTNSGFNYWLYE